MAHPADPRIEARARRRNVPTARTTGAWARSPHGADSIVPAPSPPRGKARDMEPKASPLDKLETWLGLRAADAPAPQPARAPAPRRPAENAQPAHTGSAAQVLARSGKTVDALVHPVAPADTLPSISLRYGADANVVRRSNRLWIGDAVQMRSELYIPVACCRWKPPHAQILVLERAADGSLSTQVELVDESSARGVQVAAVDTDDLLVSGRATPNYGESGLDDLLAEQRERRERGERGASSRPGPAAKPARVQAHAPDSERDVWQPNVWRFNDAGARQQRDAQAPRHSGDVIFETEGDLLGLDEPHEPPRDAPRAPVRAYASQGSDLLGEVAQTLGPNSGAAAHWVRPIHDSLPTAPRPRAQGGRTVGSLFGDMVRGRISVEDAFGAAVNEFQSPRSRGAMLPL